MAKKTYAADLQTTLDDEIAALRARRESASPSVGVAPSAEASAAAPSAEEAAPRPFGAPPPAPGLPYAAPAPARPPLRRARRGLRPVVLALAVALVVLVIGVIVFATQSSGSFGIHPRVGSPGAAISAGVICLAGLVVLFLLARFLLLRRRGAPPPAPRSLRGAPVPVAGPQTIAALDKRIARLEQLRAWMGEDPELGRLIDATIGAQVRASERRQRIFSGCVAVASLAVGWILNAVSLPSILVGLFGLGH